MNWLNDVSNMILGEPGKEVPAVSAPAKPGQEADSITVIATGASRCVLRPFRSQSEAQAGVSLRPGRLAANGSANSSRPRGERSGPAARLY